MGGLAVIDDAEYHVTFITNENPSKPILGSDVNDIIRGGTNYCIAD